MENANINLSIEVEIEHVKSQLDRLHTKFRVRHSLSLIVQRHDFVVIKWNIFELITILLKMYDSIRNVFCAI